MASQQRWWSVAAAALLCLLGLATPALAYRGEGTAYSGPGDKDATGRNACGFGNLGERFETWYAAMNAQQFKGSCGRCIRARGTERPASGRWHVVKIVDMCPSCSHGDVDFSTTAFKAITGLAWDRKKIEWEWTDCDQEAAERKRKEAARRAAEKKAVEQRRREEEKRKQQEAEQKRAAEEGARRDAERAQAEEEAAQQAQQAQQAVQGQQAQQGQLASLTSDQTAAGAQAAAAGTAAGTAVANGTAPSTAQQQRPVSDWVVACDKGRQRCPNLSLAARGYQCTTLDGSACCLTPYGKLCKVLANYEHDTAAPPHWRGLDLTSNAGQHGSDTTANAEEEAEALTETGGGSAENATAAAPAVAAAAPGPAAAEPPEAEGEATDSMSNSPPTQAAVSPAPPAAEENQTAESGSPYKQLAASPVAAPASRRLLKH